MRTAVARSLLALVTAGCLSLPAPAATAAGMVGETAADFSLTDVNGVVHTLSQYRGKVVFLNFFGYS